MPNTPHEFNLSDNSIVTGWHAYLVTCWREFKSVIFPWLMVAATAIAMHYVEQLHHATLKNENTALRQVNQDLSAQVGRLTDVLTTQGYVVSPFRQSFDATNTAQRSTK